MKTLFKVLPKKLQKNFSKTTFKKKEVDGIYIDVDTMNMVASKFYPQQVRVDDARYLEDEKFFRETKDILETKFEENYPTIGKIKKFELGPKDIVFDRLSAWKDMTMCIVTKQDIIDLQNESALKNTYLLIDVRSPFKAEDFKIPGSVNIPFQDIASLCLELSPKVFMNRYRIRYPDYDCNLILFGDEPNETELAGIAFKLHGWVNTFNFRGGVQEWFGSEFKILKKFNERVMDKIGESVCSLKEDLEDELQEIDVDHEDLPYTLYNIDNTPEGIKDALKETEEEEFWERTELETVNEMYQEEDEDEEDDQEEKEIMKEIKESI